MKLLLPLPLIASQHSSVSLLCHTAGKPLVDGMNMQATMGNKIIGYVYEDR